MTDDPYHDIKVRHKAKLISQDGTKVSPVCAKKPRALNLAKENWVLEWNRVDCPKCLKQKPETT